MDTIAAVEEQIILIYLLKNHIDTQTRTSINAILKLKFQNLLMETGFVQIATIILYTQHMLVHNSKLYAEKTQVLLML